MALNPGPRPDRWSTKLVSTIGNTFRSEKSYTQQSIDKKNQKSKLKKKNPNPPPSSSSIIQEQANELGEQEYAVFAENRRPARPKIQDNGEMMHSLARTGSFDSLVGEKPPDPFATDVKRKRRGYLVSKLHEQRISNLPDELWQRISHFLSPVEACNLALSTKTLHRKLHNPSPCETLNRPENKNHKIAFLNQFDAKFPLHLLCPPCAKFHPRLHPGSEIFKKDFVANALFHCPKVKTSILPRTRLTYARELPYAFIQLVLRASKFGPAYGIPPENLARKWKCNVSGWTHTTRYLVHEGRLLMRVVSQRFAPPARELSETGERHILYDREEYVPFFSVCGHWRDGELMKICKCTLSHIPSPPTPYTTQLKTSLHLSKSAAHPNFLILGCDFCRPARRCPECPTEYLVETRLVEDPTDTIVRFKHAIVVTRWADLGDGSSPYVSPEWVAINGTAGIGTEGGYESFKTIGRRAVGGIFESVTSGSTPGQRLISLNPSNKKLGEEGTGWY